MSTSKVWRILMSSMAIVLALSSFAAGASAATLGAPAAQELRAQEVKGTIPGGQSAEIWLGLETINKGDNITLTSTWDREDPAGNGVGFYVLDEQDKAAVLSGTDPSQANLATGSQLAPDSPGNEVGAVVRATSDFFTIIVYNNSNSDANFTLAAQNAVISDGSGQVEDASMSEDEMMDEEMADEEMTDEEAAADATEEPTAEADEATPEADSAEPAADDTEASATPEAATEEPEATATPVAVTTPGVVEAQELEGELPEQGDQHFLGLEPSEKDGTMRLVMAFDPRDNSQLATRIGFWVLDQSAFNRFLNPNENVVLSEVALAAGSGDEPGLIENERSANVAASGFGPYTVVVYNDSNVPAEYTLTVTGGTLRDDSGQTTTAMMGMDDTDVMTDTVDSQAVVVDSEGGDEAGAAPTREGEIGGTYTVQSGDTLSLIARDIYGDVGLWEELCAYNNLADCNILEVGDTIQLPAQDELGTGATAPAAAATPAPAAATTTTATATATATQTATVTTTEPVTATTGVTATTEVTATGGVSDTAAADTASTTSTVDLMTLLEAQGGMTMLVDALRAASLDDTLAKDPGPFTLFAPTDAAFEGTLGDTYESLLANPAGDLTQLLLYHVVSDSELMSSDIVDGMQATTAHQGLPVKFEVTDDGVKVQDSLITGNELAASNGVIHIIDKVMIPSDIQ